MAKIVYLLGAGASFGIRDDKQLEFNLQENNITRFNRCANIKEGLPIVSELPNRMLYIISKLLDFVKDIPTDDVNRREYITLIEDFKWAHKEGKRHSTIDTFAKKLYITKQVKEYNRLKRVMSVYFTLEQILGVTDKRYDAFFASILKDSAIGLPQNISIVSWNYDCQIELAFAEYLQQNDLNCIEGALNMFHKTGKYDNVSATGFNILKLNGSALIYDKERNIFIDPYNERGEMSIISFLTLSTMEHSNTYNALSFAWENMGESFIEVIKNSIKDADTLVVIGYSFPYFNREVDKLLFENMTKLKKIYIQDQYPDRIEESVRNLLTISHNVVNKTTIEKQYNLTQFYLPPEL